MIDSKDITVVVQGPVRPDTKKCFDSIRRVLPNAEIIFSTWTGEDLCGIEPDRTVRSVMPPAYPQHRDGTLSSLNRLLRSTKAGVALAERKYVLKIRSDLVIESDCFLRHFDAYPARGPRAVFKHKIVVPLTFSRREYRKHPVPFHLSDWAAFGLREDIAALYLETPEVEEPAFSQYFLDRPDETPFETTTFRMAPEQYFCYSAFERSFSDIRMRDAGDAAPDVIRASDEFIVSNFLIPDYSKTGWHVAKYPESKDEFSKEEQFFTLWSEYVYQYFYKKHCDPSFVIPESKSRAFCRRRRFYETLGRLKKHADHLLHAAPSKRFEQLLIIPFLALKLGVLAFAGKLRPAAEEPIRFDHE